MLNHHPITASTCRLRAEGADCRNWQRHAWIKRAEVEECSVSKMFEGPDDLDVLVGSPRGDEDVHLRQSNNHLP